MLEEATVRGFHHISWKTDARSKHPPVQEARKPLTPPLQAWLSSILWVTEHQCNFITLSRSPQGSSAPVDSSQTEFSIARLIGLQTVPSCIEDQYWLYTNASFGIVSLAMMHFLSEISQGSRVTTYLLVRSLYKTRCPHSLQRIGSPFFKCTLELQSPHKY